MKLVTNIFSLILNSALRSETIIRNKTTFFQSLIFVLAEDVEILLLQTRLDQTEQTLQKLIGWCMNNLQQHSLTLTSSRSNGSTDGQPGQRWLGGEP